MRAKHGHYNTEKQLPDNTGQPTGDATRVWLIEAVRKLWPDLANAAQQQPGDRYRWLVEQLRAMQDEQADAIMEEYRAKINASQRQRAQLGRLHQLAQYEQLAQTCDVEQLDYIEKRIATLKKQIAKHSAEVDGKI